MSGNRMKYPFQFSYFDKETDEILRKDFTGYIKGCLKVEPKGYFFPRLYEKYAEDIYNFSLRDDDLFVASYPKSGTTWTQEMVWMIQNDLDYEKSKVILDERFPFLELDFVVDADLFITNEFMKEKLKGSPPEEYETLQFVNNLSSPRCIKTHMPFSLLPPNLLDKCKVIFVTRDPRDVIVSYYHHHRLIRSHGFHDDFSKFFNYFIEEKVMWSPFWTHFHEYYSMKEHPNLLMIEYNDMKTNLQGVIQRVASFLGKNIEDDEMEKLVDHLSLSSMKTNPSVNGESDLESGLFISSEEGFIRKGKSGGWKGYFDENMKEIYQNWVSKYSNGAAKELNWEM